LVKYLLIEDDPGARDSTKVDPIGVMFICSILAVALILVGFRLFLKSDPVTLN
jgi:hypothetical protein